MNKMNRENYRINLPILLTFEEFIKNKKELDEEDIKTIFNFSNYIIELKFEPTFEETLETTPKKTPEIYTGFLNLLKKNNYFIEHPDESTISDEFDEFCTFQFSIDDIIGFVSNIIRFNLLKEILKEIQQYIIDDTEESVAFIINEVSVAYVLKEVDKRQNKIAKLTKNKNVLLKKFWLKKYWFKKHCDKLLELRFDN